MNNPKATLPFPLSLLAVGILSSIGLSANVDIALLPPIATAFALVLVVGLERLLPRARRQPEERETAVDLGFVVLTAGVSNPMAEAAVIGVVASVVGTAEPGLVAHLPLAAAFVLLLLVDGCGDYWSHRLAHELPWWWKLHSVHHAPHRMVALNNFRIHPLDLGLKVLFRLAPVLLLGFSAEAIALAGAFKGVTLAFQHADADLRHGWLNRILSTNSLHRWHHSAARGEAGSNYGSTLSIFDQLFGTYLLPPEEDDPDEMGLFDERHYPVHTIGRALFAPFRSRNSDRGLDSK